MDIDFFAAGQEMISKLLSSPQPEWRKILEHYADLAASAEHNPEGQGMLLSNLLVMEIKEHPELRSAHLELTPILLAAYRRHGV